MSIGEPITREPGIFKLGMAWVLLCLALAVHVTDEASTGFLAVYNPTVVALRARLGFWPMPTFEFREWLTGLVFAVLVLLALSPFLPRIAMDSAVVLLSRRRDVGQRPRSYGGNNLRPNRKFSALSSPHARFLFVTTFACCVGVRAHPVETDTVVSNSRPASVMAV